MILAPTCPIALLPVELMMSLLKGKPKIKWLLIRFGF